MPSYKLAILSILILFEILLQIQGKPTIYMKNENDKLEPLLLPVSSTVIPIPIGHHRVEAGVRVYGGKLTKHKIKLNKPNGPGKLITVTGLKKMAPQEITKY